jgi:hypothetical protein
MTLRDPARNILVSLTGLIAIVVIGHVMFEWSAHHFEAYNPPLALLVVLLLCINFLGIGYFATRFPVLQSAFVCFMGSMTVTVVDYLPAIYPGRHYWPRAEMLGFIREQFVPVGIACVLAFVGAWFRNRANIRRQQARDATPRLSAFEDPNSGQS